jgi:uncharacterized protein YdhG (YjbR/CyaY superfamily)
MMKTNQPTPTSIDEYIATFPHDLQAILEQIRSTIKAAAPEAKETISYNMPGFTLNGHYMVYFAAYKKHIGMYPVPTGDAQFNAELSVYVAGKGTVRFPFDKPIPFDLIRAMITYLVRETLERAAAKEKRK